MQPDTVWSYELGEKSSWLVKREYLPEQKMMNKDPWLGLEPAALTAALTPPPQQANPVLNPA